MYIHKYIHVYIVLITVINILVNNKKPIKKSTFCYLSFLLFKDKISKISLIHFIKYIFYLKR